ncbi:hypothetical protein [Nitrosospira sp. NRS527]|uniref:hypothetical protein n=1 Tax=Nitrosospira sp. NRS527 TaxID=155925 RepID=UPI001BCFF091|nr:hypothetical protein [Nitrosospira sp. NRS527]
MKKNRACLTSQTGSAYYYSGKKKCESASKDMNNGKLAFWNPLILTSTQANWARYNKAEDFAAAPFVLIIQRFYLMRFSRGYENGGNQ